MSSPHPKSQPSISSSKKATFSEAFDTYHGALIHYAARITGDMDAAYDIVQATFEKLWTMREDIDPNGSLRALLYKMVRNRSLNHERMKKNERSFRSSLSVVETTANSPQGDLELKRLRAQLAKWISALPDRQKEAFRLSRFEGLKHEEIAEVMGLTTRTVTNHIMLALNAIREQLEIYQTESI